MTEFLVGSRLAKVKVFISDDEVVYMISKFQRFKLVTKYSILRLIEPPVNRFLRLIGSKFHRIYRTELQFD